MQKQQKAGGPKPPAFYMEQRGSHPLLQVNLVVDMRCAALDLAPASVRSRLSRGRETLRKKLEKEVRL